MRKYFLSVLIFSLVFGALVYQRLDTPEQHVVTVQDVLDGDTFVIGETFPRGSIIATEDESLVLTIGPDRVLALAPRTTIELKRLFHDDVVLGFTRGRIALVSEDPEFLTTIETNHTISRMESGSLTMVNFDFLETVHVISLSEPVDVYLQLTDETFTTTEALGIHETAPVTTEPIQPDLSAGDAGDFYHWFGWSFD